MKAGQMVKLLRTKWHRNGVPAILVEIRESTAIVKPWNHRHPTEVPLANVSEWKSRNA